MTFIIDRNFYGIPEDFPRNQIMYRAENGQRRTLYFVSSAIRDLVRRNNDRFKVSHLKSLESYSSGKEFGIQRERVANCMFYFSEEWKKQLFTFVFQFINLGVKIFGRSKSPLVPDCDYRIAQEVTLSFILCITCICRYVISKFQGLFMLKKNIWVSSILKRFYTN